MTEVIYVFRQTSEGQKDLVVKIGKCIAKDNVEERIRKLQTGSPVPVVLLKTFECDSGTAKDIEKYVHDSFARCRHREGGTEYFNFGTMTADVLLSLVREKVEKKKELMVPEIALASIDASEWDASRVEGADTELNKTVECLRQAKADLELAKAQIAAYDAKVRAAFLTHNVGRFNLKDSGDKITFTEVTTNEFDPEAFENGEEANTVKCYEFRAIDTQKIKREAPDLFKKYSRVKNKSMRLNVGK
jgi:hypothetical protein